MKRVCRGILLFAAVLFAATCVVYIRFDAENMEKIFEDRYSVSVLDDKGNIIGVHLNKDEQWHLKSVDEIPEKLKMAVVTFEDKNFYSHHGVDFPAAARAVRDNLFKKKRTGASTITMQSAKMLKPKKRSYFNKYLETVQALKIERYFSKDEILAMYLNNAPYGSNIVGYKTASYMYFQKNPKELTWAEGALLAVLPNSPGLMSVEKNREKLLEKRNNLLKKMAEKNIIDERQYNLSVKEPLPEKKYSFKSLAPHLVRRLINENDDKIIHSTINSELQEKTEKIVKDYAGFLKTQGIKNTAVLVIDNETYKVKVYAGSQDFYDFSVNGQVDGVMALRSPGSLLKPFLYAKAIDEGVIAPQSKVPDVPLYFSNFSPQNAGKEYYGMVEIKDALVKSLNIPFVQLLKEYGEDKFFFFLKEAVGFKDMDYSQYGLSLILGTKEFTMEEIGKLYTGLANYGNFKNLRYTENKNDVEEGEQLISKGASYLTLSTIRELERPGMEKIYRDKNPISWKTGTSHGRRDGWAAGVTPKWTVIVWTGNFTGESSPNLTGVYSAGNLLFNIFKILPRDTGEKREFSEPEDLQKIKVDLETGYRLKYDVPFKEILYPESAKPLKTSPYYKKIFVNNEGVEIDSRSPDFSERKEKIVLSYPIDVINYFVKENLDISKIFMEKSASKTIKFIYPADNLKIILPRDFDGEKSIIVKTANLKNQNLYWYVNKEYVGKGREAEKNFNLREGMYEITVVAENGETAKVRFEILKKPKLKK